MYQQICGDPTWAALFIHFGGGACSTNRPQLFHGTLAIILHAEQGCGTFQRSYALPVKHRAAAPRDVPTGPFDPKSELQKQSIPLRYFWAITLRNMH